MHHSTISLTEIDGILRQKTPMPTVAFLGIGGIGISSLARLFSRMGYGVIGYDRERSLTVCRLQQEGITVKNDSDDPAFLQASLLVYSLALDKLPPSLEGIPSVSRAQLLGWLMQRYKARVGVSGSHGKSTVSAVIDHIFWVCGKNPTSILGANLSDGVPLRMGGEELLVYEACEYRDSFLYFGPTLSVFLNLELDHTDYFKSMEMLKKSFLTAAELADKVLYLADDPALCWVADRLTKEKISFGRSACAFYRADQICYEKGRIRYRLCRGGEVLGKVEPQMLGTHALENSLAAIAAAIEMGIDPQSAIAAASDFAGIERRLQRIGSYGSQALYYDYAHHPTEIRAGIRALHDLYAAPPTVIFAPHTYTRTRDLFFEFANALSQARCVLLFEIYSAREAPIEGVDSEHLAEAIRAMGTDAFYVRTAKEALPYLKKGQGAIVLMGAGELSGIKSLLMGNK